MMTLAMSSLISLPRKTMRSRSSREQPRVDVEGALAALTLLDHVRDERHRGLLSSCLPASDGF